MNSRYMQNAILEVKNLTKKFGEFTAVDNISFELKEGEILGLLGPNGAGKTTTIQMLLGVMEPTNGQIVYFGKPFIKNRESILKNINYSSGYISFPWVMTIKEILNVYSRLYEVPKKEERIQKLLAIFEIEDLLKKQFYRLSEGQKSRVFLVKAFLNYPKILLLDEPTTSLDPDIAKKVREFLKKERGKFNVSMLITSHNMSEVEELCNKIIFIDHGKIIKEGTPEDIARNITDSCLRLMIVKNTDRAVAFLKKQGIAAIKDRFYLTVTIAENQIATVLSALAKENITYEEISIDKPDLEDFFLSMTRKKYD